MGTPAFDPRRIDRPALALLWYSTILALLSGPFFPFVFIPLFLRYHSMRYTFDDTGVSMRWGVFFRREVFLAYRRIQDIHLRRNVLERWLGLATIDVQTASGSARPELSIVGIPQFEALREYLYSRTRGATDEAPTPAEDDGDGAGDEALALLTEIRDLLRAGAGNGGRGSD